ncbi:triose-phosphate transporter [Lasallia pustulata]|uniref:Triose-phosphate transporter n=1 Tax=Lasallia pustulata TaxID=136370 RepID=A0A1W5CU09_9LECA|nr:triose-phosphate transporter [Lasallia pustulata]
MTSASERRWSTSSNHAENFKFPDFEAATSPRSHLPVYEEEGATARTSARTPSPIAQPISNGFLHSERWQPRRENHVAWSNGQETRHGRQKSLSDAIRTIRTRKGSVSANAHEIADALKAPVSVKLVVFCLVWYTSSALTNTSSKSILNAFPKPITLTLVQFAFVSAWCVLFAYLAHLYPSLKTTIPALRHGIRAPTREVINTTLPLALFQIGGHILSATATSVIPVSLVHTIKGLSPLFTVLAYRFIFHIRYPVTIYLSLIPLTLGVILACSVEFSGNLFGILCAFGGALIFVTQNIFSKKLFNEAARAEADSSHMHQSRSRTLDKLNLLCYCSGLAFLLTFPLWLWSEGLPLLQDFLHDGSIDLTNKHDALDHGRLTLEFLFNGIFHFGQNIIAFVLLSLVSPVTYSVASLIKRVFIIVAAIVWFGNTTTPVQAAGIALTFLGLYLYDRTSDAAKADRRARLEQLRGDGPLLPLALDAGRVEPGRAEENFRR